MTPGSFRDPAGYLVVDDKGVRRFVHTPFVQTVDAFLASKAAKTLIEQHAFVRSWSVAETAEGKWYEHERIDFPAYPFEWTAPMLHAAGDLTLRVAEALLEDGFVLKDATPFNVLFVGPEPVFVDLLSVDRVPPTLVWRALAQMERTFVLPLVAFREFGMDPTMLFLRSREGISPEEMARCLRPIDRLRPSLFGSVVLPALLGRYARSTANSLASEPPRADVERVKFTFRSLFRRTRRTLRRLKPRVAVSEWTEYGAGNTTYDANAADAKRQFVRGCIERSGAERVLDVGCNTGTFAKVAAESGAKVVAIDRDHAAVTELWTAARHARLDILPLVVDIARPTPATGWMGEETLSFLQRAEGHFDVVLALALVHHLMITERIPLSSIVDLLARLTKRVAIVEFISPADAMFRQLLRGRDDLHGDFNRESFERAFTEAFAITAQIECGPTRAIYELIRR